MKPESRNTGTPLSGNFTVRDEFNSDKLDLQWTFLRTPRERWYDLQARKGWLALQVRPEACLEPVNPSFLARRQQHLRGSAAVEMDFSANEENEKAGLLIFQNETHFYFLCKSVAQGMPVVQLYKSGEVSGKPSKMELLAAQEFKGNGVGKHVPLKIEAGGGLYSFFCSTQPGKWTVIKKSVDGHFLSGRVCGVYVRDVCDIIRRTFNEQGILQLV